MVQQKRKLTDEQLGGFTLVELIITIIVVAILATLVTLGLGGVQQSARDGQRNASATVIAEELEKYYAEHGEYPSCSSLSVNPSAVATNVLEGIDEAVLKSPTGKQADNNSLICGTITGATGSDVFVFTGDGSSACATGASCLEWTLSYREESSGEVKTIKSRHRTDIATSGGVTLSVSTTSSSSALLKWNAVPNTISYSISRSTQSNMSGAVTSSVSGTATSTSATGLLAGKTYYFRIVPVASGSTGENSNIASTTTSISQPSTVPSIAVSISGTTVQGAASNGGVCEPGATLQYSIRYNSTGTATAGAWSSYTTGAVRNEGTMQGRNYTFVTQTRCVGSHASSSYRVGAAASAIAPVNQPSGTPTVAASVSGTTANATASNAGTCAADTTASYGIRYHATNVASSGTWTAYGTGATRSVGTSQGYKYTFQPQARCTGYYASSSYKAGTAGSTVAPVNQPSGTATVAASISGTTANSSTANAGSCAAGTTVEYGMRYNATNVAAAGTWTAYTIGTTRSAGTSQGYKYTFQSRTRCVGYYASSTYKTGNSAAVVASINKPATPVYAGPSSFRDGVYAIVNYTTYCPSGTWPSGTFRSQFVNTGVYYGPHPFGFNDWWWTSAFGYINYWGKYQCVTSHASSPMSNEHHRSVPINT